MTLSIEQVLFQHLLYNGYVYDSNAKYFQGINFFSKDLKFCICTPKQEETKQQRNEIWIPSLCAVLQFLVHSYGLSSNSEHPVGTKRMYWNCNAIFRKTIEND